MNYNLSPGHNSVIHVYALNLKTVSQTTMIKILSIKRGYTVYLDITLLMYVQKGHCIAAGGYVSLPVYTVISVCPLYNTTDTSS